jgi:hypothetical protein
VFGLDSDIILCSLSRLYLCSGIPPPHLNSIFLRGSYDFEADKIVDNETSAPHLPVRPRTATTEFKTEFASLAQPPRISSKNLRQNARNIISSDPR